MASDIKEAIRRLLYEYRVEGADDVMAAQEAVAASTTKTDKASLSLEKAFGSLERRYVETTRYQQDYQKVQDKVNAAVAQNPELQERANVVLAAAAQHFNDLANKGNFFTEIMVKGFTRFLGPMALVNLALTGIGAAIGYMAAQWESSSRTIDQVLEEHNRLLKETKALTESAALSQERMFAQAPEVTLLQATQNLADAQIKLNEALERGIALAEKRITTPTQVPGEMGEAPTGLAPLAPQYEQLTAAVEKFKAAQREGTANVKEFNAEIARIVNAVPGLEKIGLEIVGWATKEEEATKKAEALKKVLLGIADDTDRIAAGLKTIAQTEFNKIVTQETADAAERVAKAMLELAAKYPGTTLETAKQLELLEAQLQVARARTEEERLLAEEKKRVLELTLLQGKRAEEALEIAKKERQIAETKAETEETEKLAAANAKAATQAARMPPAVSSTNREMDKLTSKAKTVAEVFTGITDSLLQWDTILEAVDHRLSELNTQFGDKQYVSSYDPLGSATQKAGLEKTYGAENIEPFYSGLDGALVGYRVKQDYLNSQQGQQAPILSATDALQNFRDSQSKISDLINNLKDLTGSTDALNATMQNALSPYYSQDPRTTKLGFRAGSVGNPDWMVPGASNANPLAAVLGYGATAPGMANGGSFIVGGGYSANDNKIAAFPVASGEQVVVNRSPGGGAKVVNIDNRIIVNGAVDGDALSKLKVSRYQQTQRMRAGLAQA